MPPSSGSKYKASMKQVATCYLPSKKPAGSFAYSSSLKMEARYSSEMSTDFQRTILLYIPEDSIT
jgi:hypothetical protein